MLLYSEGVKSTTISGEPVTLIITTEIYRGKKKILYFLKETYKGQNRKSRKPEKYRTKHIH